jgi:hypothetical protein
MRTYHFLSGDDALDDISNRHLKLSEIDKLNDPFELWCTAQGDKELRRDLRKWKAEMAEKYGMLCFCLHWHNPVLWSHYADRHRGICLGFDVPDNSIKAVQYVASRTPLRFPLTEAAIQKLLFTKYRDWNYEEEWRGWFRLDTRDQATGLFFYDFDEKIQLREVIVGPLCEIPRSKIEAAIGGYIGPVHIVKARLAFKTFRVVTNKIGFANSRTNNRNTAT